MTNYLIDIREIDLADLGEIILPVEGRERAKDIIYDQIDFGFECIERGYKMFYPVSFLN